MQSKHLEKRNEANHINKETLHPQCKEKQMEPSPHQFNSLNHSWYTQTNAFLIVHTHINHVRNIVDVIFRHDGVGGYQVQ